MKNLICLLMITFLTSAVFADEAKDKLENLENDLIYTIHVGAFVNIQPTDFIRIRPLGFMYIENYDERLKRVYIGDFATEAEANKMLTKVKTNGYPDAFVTSRELLSENQVAMIQIVSETWGNKLEWGKYSKAGALVAESIGKSIKIGVGTYPTAEMARKRMGSIRKAGFNDAFVRMVNKASVHRITDFESAGRAKLSAGLTRKKTQSVTKGTNNSSSDEIPVQLHKSKKKKKEQPKDVPKEYDDLRPKGVQNKGVSLPTIREDVKRNSVFELQKALKAEAAYSGSLDGLYGSGTAKGYKQALATNKSLQKYKLLQKHEVQFTEKGTSNIMQHYINTLLEDTPKAVKGLETTASPIAKAYRAYILFQTDGDQGKLDYLMNLAIKETFVDKPQKNKPPFDYKSKYTYQDVDQLILHLRYIQSAADSEMAFPCWLFQAHPEEASAAFQGGSEFRVENCNDLMQWEELSLLNTIAADLNPAASANAKLAGKYADEQAKLFLFPSAIEEKEGKLIEAWYQSLWKGLNAWEKSDPLHKKLIAPFRVSFFQSMIRMEDYFMDQRFNAKEARLLSINVLKTIINPHMASYLR